MPFPNKIGDLTRKQYIKLLRQITSRSLYLTAIFWDIYERKCDCRLRKSNLINDIIFVAKKQKQYSQLKSELNFAYDKLLVNGIPKDYIQEFLHYNRECWKSPELPPISDYLG